MPQSRQDLLIALALIVGGVCVFFLYLFLMGRDPDVRPLGLLDWIVAGVLIAPGLRYLVRWRQARGG